MKVDPPTFCPRPWLTQHRAKLYRPNQLHHASSQRQSTLSGYLVVLEHSLRVLVGVEIYDIKRQHGLQCISGMVCNYHGVGWIHVYDIRVRVPLLYLKATSVNTARIGSIFPAHQWFGSIIYI